MKNKYLICRLFLMFGLCLTTGIMTVRAQQNQEAKLRLLDKHEQAVHVLDKYVVNPFIETGSDGYYYLTGTTPNDTPSSKRSSIKIWRSKDLVDWEEMPAIKIPERSGFLKEMTDFSQKRDIEQYVYSPRIHFINDRWVVVHTSGSRVANVMLSASSDIQGPYTEPLGLEVGFQVDPMVFVDSDGTPWLISNCTQIRKIKKDFSGFAGNHRLIGPKNRQLGFEGSQMIKINDRYLLFGTSWSTDVKGKGTYNLYYTCADKILGPYSPRKFAGRFIGNGVPFQDKNGRWWALAFQGVDQISLTAEQALDRDLSDSAYTINKKGLTLVPLEIKEVDGELIVQAKDSNYQTPGQEEMQKF